jgi:predicted aspartyl protease
MRACLLVSLWLLTAPPPGAGSATPFQLGDQGAVIVPVTLNGKGPFKMLLDTGATHTAITADVAAIAGATPVARSTVITPAGSAVRPIVAVDRLTIGPVISNAVRPSVVPSGSFDPDATIHGLIGQDVLAALRYTLDFKRRQVEWHDAEPSRHGLVLPLAFEQGRFLLRLPQAATVLRLVPDSGAACLVLFGAGARTLPYGLETGPALKLVTAHAYRDARRIRLHELRLGARTLVDVPAVLIDRAAPEPAEGDGLLPLHLFERVTFDGPARVLILG